MPKQPSTDNTIELVKKIVLALSEKKADQLAILHLTQSDITDYLVLANGNSEPHLRALRIEAERVLDADKTPIAGMEQGTYGSGWTVVDAYQIMIHLFTPEQRKHYSLDKLWKDAEPIDTETLLNPPKNKPAKTPAKSAKPKKTPAPIKKTTASTPPPPAKPKTSTSGKKNTAKPKTKTGKTQNTKPRKTHQTTP